MKHNITESNFWDYRWRGDDGTGVAISRTVPDWYNWRRYPALAPTRELLAAYKAGNVSEKQYASIYWLDILSDLDRNKVIRDLGKDAVLLCWERTGFCHRHLVIEWLNGREDWT